MRYSIRELRVPLNSQPFLGVSSLDLGRSSSLRTTPFYFGYWSPLLQATAAFGQAQDMNAIL
jgi:hypothetical protein